MFWFHSQKFLITVAAVSATMLSACDDDDAILVDEDSEVDGGSGGSAGEGEGGAGSAGEGGAAGSAGEGGAGSGGGAGEGEGGAGSGGGAGEGEGGAGSGGGAGEGEGGAGSGGAAGEGGTGEGCAQGCNTPPVCFSAEGATCENDLCIYTRIPTGQPGACECLDSDECTGNLICKNHRCSSNACTNAEIITTDAVVSGNTTSNANFAAVTCGATTYVGSQAFYQVTVPAGQSTSVTLSGLGADLGLYEIESCSDLTCNQVSDKNGSNAESLNLTNKSANEKTYTLVVGSQYTSTDSAYSLTTTSCAADLPNCRSIACDASGQSSCTDCENGYTGTSCNECAAGYINTVTVGTAHCVPATACNSLQTLTTDAPIIEDTHNGVPFGTISCDDHEYNGNQQLYEITVPPHSGTRVILSNQNDDLMIVEVNSCNDLSTCKDGHIADEGQASVDEVMQFINTSNNAETHSFVITGYRSDDLSSYTLTAQNIPNCIELNTDTQWLECNHCNPLYSGTRCDECAEGYHNEASSGQPLNCVRSDSEYNCS